MWVRICFKRGALFATDWIKEKNVNLSKIINIKSYERGILSTKLDKDKNFSNLYDLNLYYKEAHSLNEFTISIDEQESFIITKQYLQNDQLYYVDDDAEILLGCYVPNKYVSIYNKISSITHGADINRIDSIRQPLPELTDDIITSHDKGLWEFWGFEKYIKESDIRSRDPRLDIKDSPIAIDFGTSSTVVAYQDERGIGQLIRIGANDFWQPTVNSDFENPTILEFIDYQNFINAWQSDTYRPGVFWSDVKGSHEALSRFRANETDVDILSSMMIKLKHWALKQNVHSPTIVKDQINKIEQIIPQLKENNPVKGKPLEVNSEYQFDPIELYAWMLGMMINWRGRGLFLNYYMTFPVDYPRDTKEKILSSFRRGLQRSFPQPFILTDEFTQFSVEERATEPLAFAAIAMDELQLEPTEIGRPYAVFDFGGGTADFDYGIYRLPTEQESDDGYDQVFENFGASGDKYLGGENILEHLAFYTFNYSQNLEELRKNKVSIVRPIDIPISTGNELLVSSSQNAQTNTLMLISQLRRFWETGQSISSSGILKLVLLSNTGEKVNCELIIPENDLLEIIENKIFEGLKNFFSALKLAFQDKPNINHVDILLSGNASQSSILQGFLGLGKAEQDKIRQEILEQFIEALFEDNPLKLTIHPPLNKGVIQNSSNINAKTGVALGLLRLVPGSTTKIINNSLSANKEGLFLFNVGRIIRNTLTVKIKQGAESGWTELGKVIERRFTLAYSQSPQALIKPLKLGEADLLVKILNFSAESENQKVFARTKGLNTLIITTAENEEIIDEINHSNLFEINL